MKNKYIISTLLVLIAVVSGYIYFVHAKQAKVESIAKCLTEKGVVMYGAEWCEHCKKQKEVFGSAFKSVTYFNCADTAETKDAKCVEEDIVKYPTWKLGTVKKVEGVYFPETLAGQFGCKI